MAQLPFAQHALMPGNAESAAEFPGISRALQAAISQVRITIALDCSGALHKLVALLGQGRGKRGGELNSVFNRLNGLLAPCANKQMCFPLLALILGPGTISIGCHGGGPETHEDSTVAASASTW